MESRDKFWNQDIILDTLFSGVGEIRTQETELCICLIDLKKKKNEI